jgi:thioredoxin 1
MSNQPDSANVSWLKRNPGTAAGAFIVLLVLWMQWPMVKGLAYRATGSAAPADGIAWQSSLQQAMTLSRQTGKPILADFSATWCPPCQAMKHDSWPDPHVRDLANANYIPLAIDIDQDQETASRYNISSIPTVMILSTDGQVRRSNTGFLSASDLAQWLTKPSPQ